MRIKQAGMMRSGILQGHRAVGNPDAFMIEIYQSARALAGGVLGTSAAKKRSMEDAHLHFPSVIGDGAGEDAGIQIKNAELLHLVVPLELLADSFQFTAALGGGLGVGHFKFVERIEKNL